MKQLSSAERKVRNSLRHHILAGVAAGFLLLGVAAFAATSELSGAVVAGGVLVVESNIKRVQHPTGGVVGELRVKDGDWVHAGDIVMRLDETITRANLAIIESNLAEMGARQARLIAERDGAEDISFPPELVARRDEADVELLLSGELRLFQNRLSARSGQRAQLQERVSQIEEQISGVNQQIEAKGREIEIIGRELVGVRELWEKKLIPIQRVTAVERDSARLLGERGALVANVAQAKGRITETQLQILQVDETLRTEVGKELADIRSRVSELTQKKVAAQDQLGRIDIRAPLEGFVFKLEVHAVGEVIRPGEPVMLIVPKNDALAVEAKVAPQDIDHVRVGLPVITRFTAFNRRTTPELKGYVSRVSADLVSEEKSQGAYFLVRVGLEKSEIERLGGLKLVPGMPVETYIQTGQRTIGSYLIKPLSDQVTRSFRDHR